MKKKKEHLEIKVNYHDPIDNFLSNMEQITSKYKIEQENQLDLQEIKQTAIKLIQKIAVIEQIEFDHALIGVCALMQSGAYLKSVTNRKVIIGGKEFSKKTLIYAAELINCNYTFRVIARSLNDVIAKIAYKYQIPGHLYSRYKIENVNIIVNNSIEQNRLNATFCADFQIENPKTPSSV